jgi:hypothetical protein
MLEVKNGTKEGPTKKREYACVFVCVHVYYVCIYTSVNTVHRTELPLGNQKLLSY